ncbi:MAG: hypothetical protein KA104_00950 [Candidatus Pacebacteria bacterium]|nr:hypothetical protein [Candidatus Paceibacterota bacterium]
MKPVVSGNRPQKLADVRNFSQADFWFKEVSKNISPDVMQRIQNGTLTEEEKANPKIHTVHKAWEKFLRYSGGAFKSSPRGTLHHPV